MQSEGNPFFVHKFNEIHYRKNMVDKGQRSASLKVQVYTQYIQTHWIFENVKSLEERIVSKENESSLKYQQDSARI